MASKMAKVDLSQCPDYKTRCLCLSTLTVNLNSGMFDEHLHACTHAHTHGLTSSQRLAHATTHIGSMHSCTRAHKCTSVNTHTYTHRKRLIDDRAEYAKLTGKTYSLRDWIGLKTQQVLIPKMRVCLKCVWIVSNLRPGCQECILPVSTVVPAFVYSVSRVSLECI
jgi:hypothetical protein